MLPTFKEFLLKLFLIDCNCWNCFFI